MNILPTEPQLSEREDYRKFSDHNEETHKDIGLIDKQDGNIIHLNTQYVLNDKIIKDIDEVIAKWILDKKADNRIEIPIDIIPVGDGKDFLKTLYLPFERYYVNFQHCSNGCEHWVLVKCGLHGYPKMYSKHLGTFLLNGLEHGTTQFVHNQLFKAKERYQEDFVEETTFI